MVRNSGGGGAKLANGGPRFSGDHGETQGNRQLDIRPSPRPLIADNTPYILRRRQAAVGASGGDAEMEAFLTTIRGRESGFLNWRRAAGDFRGAMGNDGESPTREPTFSPLRYLGLECPISGAIATPLAQLL